MTMEPPPCATDVGCRFELRDRMMCRVFNFLSSPSSSSSSVSIVPNSMLLLLVSDGDKSGSDKPLLSSRSLSVFERFCRVLFVFEVDFEEVKRDSFNIFIIFNKNCY